MERFFSSPIVAKDDALHKKGSDQADLKIDVHDGRMRGYLSSYAFLLFVGEIPLCLTIRFH
jgi:hypothetical protein